MPRPTGVVDYFDRAQQHGDACSQRDFAENDYHYVHHKIERLGLSDRITLVKGRFHETLDAVPGPFSFAFIDCKLHDSILYAAETVWPRLSPGGGCVFNDYANEKYPGATRAIDTFLAEEADTIATHGQLSTKLYFACKKSV